MRSSQRYSAMEGLEPVQARMGGHGLPVPPLVPIVAVVALLIGISIGYGLAPKPQPVAATAVAATARPEATATPEESPVSLPSGYSVDWSGGSAQVFVYTVDGAGIAHLTTTTVPPKGVSLAVAAANKVEPVDLANVVAARVEPYFVVNPGASPNIWVWAIEVRLPDPEPCLGDPSSAPASPTAGPSQGKFVCAPAFQTVVVDYKTGIWLETIAVSTEAFGLG